MNKIECLISEILIDIIILITNTIFGNFQITWFVTDPFILIQLVKTDVLEKYRLSTLKHILTSGSIFPKHHQETLRKKLPHVLINNGYGKSLNAIFEKITNYFSLRLVCF